jgi:hypothetical protein
MSARHGTEGNFHVKTPFLLLSNVQPVDVLTGTYYDGINSASIPATINTAYKWSFASNKTRADDDALRHAREEVGAATYGQDPLPSGVLLGEGPSSRPGARVQGPAMPPGFDLTLAREQAAEHRDELKTYKRKRDKMETKERIEEMVGPKPVGREGMLEKKKLKRESDRDFREKGDEGLEMDETTLMGGGDSFKAQYRMHFSCADLNLTCVSF